MHNDITQLKRELAQISRRIYSTKNLIERESDAEKREQLEKELKQLQYQALFYIEKIKNT